MAYDITRIHEEVLVGVASNTYYLSRGIQGLADPGKRGNLLGDGQ
jgi:hypothetical protein